MTALIFMALCAVVFLFLLIVGLAELAVLALAALIVMVVSAIWLNLASVFAAMSLLGLVVIAALGVLFYKMGQREPAPMLQAPHEMTGKKPEGA